MHQRAKGQSGWERGRGRAGPSLKEGLRWGESRSQGHPSQCLSLDCKEQRLRGASEIQDSDGENTCAVQGHPRTKLVQKGSWGVGIEN